MSEVGNGRGAHHACPRAGEGKLYEKKTVLLREDATNAPRITEEDDNSDRCVPHQTRQMRQGGF